MQPLFERGTFTLMNEFIFRDEDAGKNANTQINSLIRFSPRKIQEEYISDEHR